MAKHLVNRKEDWAKEGIQGYLYANNNDLIALKEFPNVVIRRDYMTLQETNSRVALLAGGGSGHEPAHLGFIGKGMLTGVICGDLFASPSTAAILAAIRFVGASNKAGVLLIIKNYTGDRLNFGLASKRAQLEGINVDWVLVDDDVALISKENTTQNRSVGRRGLCGTIIIEKIAGAMAEQRKSLKEIKAYLEFILNQNYLRTLGISLTGRVTLPGETLKEASNCSEIEVGLGIHGEAGRRKMTLPKSSELAKLTFNDYLLDPDSDSSEICLMINNLGGISNLELSVYTNDCVKYLLENKPNLKIARIYCGTFMTSLNMNGFSTTLLYIKNNNVLDLLDAHTMAPAWPKSCGKDIHFFECVPSLSNTTTNSGKKSDNENFIQIDEEKYFEFALKTICEDLNTLKDHLNELDMVCGDGDCGNSLSNVSNVILNEIENKKFDFQHPHQVFLHLSAILENGGGSLCILLALFFSAAAKAFSKLNESSKSNGFDLWNKAIDLGSSAVTEYGRAKKGDRSIIDPLVAIQTYLNDIDSKRQIDSTKDILKKLVDVTYEAVESTAKMVPNVGRASYVDSKLIDKPDAGSMGISSVVSSIYKAYLIYYQ